MFNRPRDSLVVQWLRLCVSTAEGTRLGLWLSNWDSRCPVAPRNKDLHPRASGLLPQPGQIRHDYFGSWEMNLIVLSLFHQIGLFYFMASGAVSIYLSHIRSPVDA